MALAALLLGGCSKTTSNDSAPTSGDGKAVAPQAAPGGGDVLSKPGADTDAAKALQEGGTTAGTTAGTGKVDNRSLIYRGDITVRVEDVEKTADQVRALATTLGGHVDSEKRVTGTQNASASITIRVPSKDFSGAFDRLAGLGKEQSRSSNVEDVTEAVVDLDTRITSQTASLEATRKLYDRTVTFADITSLRREIAQMEADLAALQAKKRRIDDLVALSTVTVTLIGPNTDLPTDANPTFLDGLKSGWDAFVTSVRVLVVVIGFVLPFAIAVAIPIIILIWLSRRRRRIAPAPTTQSGETSA